MVHVPDPLLPNDLVVDALAAWFAPRYRVVSLEPRAGQPYQIQTADLRATLHQFGFSSPILVGQRLGCLAALLVAAWYPKSVARLILVDQIIEAPRSAARCNVPSSRSAGLRRHLPKTCKHSSSYHKQAWGWSPSWRHW